MARPDVADYLQSDEAVLVRQGRHVGSFVGPALAATAVMLLLAGGVWFVTFRLFPDEVSDNVGIGLLALLTVVWVSWVVGIWFRVITSRYVVTDTRVYRAYGRIRFDLLQTTYDKVTDLHVRQGPLGRLWGYGDVTLQTAGTGLALQGIRDPFGIKRTIEAARKAFFDKILEEYRVEAGARAAPTIGEPAAEETAADEWKPAAPLDEATVLWDGRPVSFSLIRPLFSLLFMGLIGAAFIFVGATGPERMPLIIGLGLVVIGVLSMAGAYIQYRFTRYAITPGGVIVTSGWLTRRRVETTYDKVTDVTTYQGFFGRIFDFGNITINTAGSDRAPVVFRDLGQPERVKGLVDEARRRREAGRGR